MRVKRFQKFSKSRIVVGRGDAQCAHTLVRWLRVDGISTSKSFQIDDEVEEERGRHHSPAAEAKRRNVDSARLKIPKRLSCICDDIKTNNTHSSAAAAGGSPAV